MRPIDADALMDDIKRDSKKAFKEGDKVGSFWLGYAAGLVIKQPPIQPERAEGEWVQIYRCTDDAQPDLECPFCKHRIGWWDMGRYCAGCGAKLKGGAE